MFACEGEMAARCAAHDWTPPRSPGEVAARPAHRDRRAAAEPLPDVLSWGGELVVVYNDPFIPTLGAKHPAALGSLLPELFAEVWDEVGPMQPSVLGGGPSTFHEDLPLLIERGTASRRPSSPSPTPTCPTTPATDPGVLAVLAVTTGKVVGARRLALLNRLAGRGSQVADTQGATRFAIECLADAHADLVAGACYLPQPSQVPDRPPAWTETGAFGASAREQPLGDLVAAVAAEGHRVIEPLTPGVDPASPTSRVALPVRGRDGTAAVLVLWPHPRRPLDEDHLTFLDLVSEHVGLLLSAGRARDEDQARLAAMAAVDAAKTAFVSNVSHEFRTPLTLILGPLEDALASGAPVGVEDVSAMYQSAHRLLRLVNGLLDIARIGAGSDPSTRSPPTSPRSSATCCGPSGPPRRGPACGSRRTSTTQSA